jgi:MOSC domain-containing protein
MFEGSVAGLYRWPVKSLRGERIDTALLDDRGLAGDRAHALVDLRPNRAGQLLTVRQIPRLLGWGSGYGTDVIDPVAPPRLRAPDGREWSWTDPGLAGVLTEFLDIPVETRRADGMQDRGPTVLVTVETSRAVLEEELSGTVELARFRTNVHLTLDAPPFAEEDWGPGTTITVGDVVLEAVGERAGPCIRCAVPSWEPTGRERWRKLQSWLIEQHDNKFGVIMRVTRAGLVRTGEPAYARPNV